MSMRSSQEPLLLREQTNRWVEAPVAFVARRYIIEIVRSQRTVRWRARVVPCPFFWSYLGVPCALCINQEQTRSINPWCASSLWRNLMCSLNFAMASDVMESCLGVTQELRPHASPKLLNEDAGIECESLHCARLGSTCAKWISAV